VEDALAEIARAAVVVAPLRSGSGTRIKILEAWRAARPVVATKLAAEGLHAVDGENVIFVETAGEFAAAIDRLLRDSELRRTIAKNGRITFEKRYTWNAAWRSLDEYYK
jgi:glycosyltransferase involved in cell wall biosynthesis